MLLDELLKSLGRKKTAEVTGLTIHMSNKFFLNGENRKVPNLNSLVLLSDYLGLDDEELGELARDTASIRAGIELSKASRLERVNLDQGSLVAKIIKSQGMLSEGISEDVSEEFLDNEDINALKRLALQKRMEASIRSKKLEEIKRLQEQLQNNLSTEGE